MKKAIPKKKPARLACTRPSWALAMATFDRQVRYSNLKWKSHVIRIDTTMVGIIASDRTFPREVLKNMGSYTPSEITKWKVRRILSSGG
jgi:hypothetical protein